MKLAEFQLILCCWFYEIKEIELLDWTGLTLLNLLNRQKASKYYEHDSRYFNGTAVAAFFKIQKSVFKVGWATVFFINLVLYLKDLKVSVFTIALSNLYAASLKSNP